MAVAKSYEKYEFDGEPFEENKKMYINVITPKGIKKVRWYTDNQKAAIYKNDKKQTSFNAKKVFGFEGGDHILVYFGTDTKINNWRNDYPPYTIMYNTIFGWYTPNDKIEIIKKIPDGITCKPIFWQQVNDGTDVGIKDYDTVRKIVKENK